MEVDKSKERWKRIAHHPQYEVSDHGNLRNTETGNLLKASIHYREDKGKTKYLRIELRRPRKKYMVHRLVAEAFIENPSLLPQVNHKDENGLNNHYKNLEWCTNKYNCSYSQGSKVRQLTREGELIETYPTIQEAAARTGSDFRLISAVCVGKRNFHNNYKWEYDE